MDILVRGVSEETAKILEEKALAVGKNRQQWLAEQLERLADLPLVRERYTLKAYGPGRAFAQISRLASGTLSFEYGAEPRDLTKEQYDAYERAKAFVIRNEPGDREAAYKLLVKQFEEVFELLR